MSTSRSFALAKLLRGGTKIDTASTNATNANTASTLVSRDASGNFSAGTITATLSGNASTATTATTLSGLTSSITELNYTDGVTSSIQTQLNAKAPLSSPALTGSPTAPTATVGTNDTKIATTAFVVAEIANRGFDSANAVFLIDSSYVVTRITNLADTKLATIATAGKVSNSATTATNANTASAIVARDASGNFTAGTITAALSGNATTATTLQNARTIAISGDVTGSATSFNGGANITISAGITAGSIVDDDVNASAAIADTKLATISTAGKVSNSATTATNANTANMIVARDGSGNFSAGTITAALSGNATTATTLTTGRNFSLTGSITAPAISFNGSGDVSLATSIAVGVVDSNALGALSVSSAKLQANIPDSKLATISTASKVSNSATTATNANTANAIVARDASGNFTAGTVTATLSGNATTATTLQNARTIGGVSFDGSANINLPGVNTAGNQNTTGSAASLTTGRTIALTGDVTYTSESFNGAANVTGTATLASVGTAGTYTKVTTDAKGRVTSGTTLAATDIPNLDAAKITSGTIDAARLPSYVDDVLEYANLAGFPATGETGKLYVALDTNKVYRWSGSTYIYITSGAVDSVAGRTGVVTLVKGDVGLGSVDNTADASKSVASAATLTTARTIAISGDVTGSATSFNGSANITISASITAGSIVSADFNSATSLIIYNSAGSAVKTVYSPGS